MSPQPESFCPVNDTGEHQLKPFGKHFETREGELVQYPNQRCTDCKTEVIDRRTWERPSLF